MRCLTLFSVIIICFSCTDKNKFINEQKTTITSFPGSIKVIHKDSVYTDIILGEYGNLRSILPYNSGILEGNAFEFYPDGRLKKMLELNSGRLSGDAVYFYESGALWKKIRFKREQHEFMKIEFWDNIIPVKKHYFEIDSNAVITKIKNFDIKGQFIKDSFPENRTELVVE